MIKKWMLSCALLAPVMTANAGTAEVLSNVKTGSTSEEATYVDSGTWAGRVAFLDGLDVLVTGVAEDGVGVPGKGLCKDIRGEGLALGHLKCPTKATQVAFAFQAAAGWHPRGLAFVPGADEFVFNDLRVTDANGVVHLFPLSFYDGAGNKLRDVPVQHLPGFVPSHVEALDYFPSTHPAFPGRLAMVVFQEQSPDYHWLNIAIMTLDGQVERYIPLNHPDFGQGIYSVAVLGNDRLLVAPNNGALYEVDFTGAVVAGPFSVEGAASLESVDLYPDGRIFAADYGLQKAWTFDSSYVRIPEGDLSFGAAPGLAGNGAVMEDPASDDLLVYSWPNTVYRVPRDLGSKTPVLAIRESPIGMNSQGVDMITDDGRIVVGHHTFENGTEFWGRAISYFSPPYDAASFTVGFRPLAPFPFSGAPQMVLYVPTTSELYVRFATRFVENRNRFLVYGLDGIYRRTVTLPLGNFTAAAFMSPTDAVSPGNLVLFAGGKIHVVSLDGSTVLASHDLAITFGLSDMVQDETDVTGRTFIGVSSEPSHLIRFRLP